MRPVSAQNLRIETDQIPESSSRSLEFEPVYCPILLKLAIRFFVDQAQGDSWIVLSHKAQSGAAAGIHPTLYLDKVHRVVVGSDFEVR